MALVVPVICRNCGRLCNCTGAPGDVELIGVCVCGYRNVYHMAAPAASDQQAVFTAAGPGGVYASHTVAIETPGPVDAEAAEPADTEQSSLPPDAPKPNESTEADAAAQALADKIAADQAEVERLQQEAAANEAALAAAEQVLHHEQG